jgi:hypothetical protein
MIERSDIMPMQDYARVRDDRRRAIAQLKKNRRVHVGPDVTLYFENRETMLHQVHEMLAVEKGGEEQIEDELRAYNPLIPRGRELVATMMIEIDDAIRRDAVLRQLGGIDKALTLTIGDETIAGIPESDIDRTTADGKTSSVHFLRFPFTEEQIKAFSSPGTRAVLGFCHPAYGHMALIPEAVRAALAEDFD